MNWYNGFSPAQRAAAEKAITRAFYAGTYTPVPVCELCTLPGVLKGKESPHLMFHCEDYARPFEATIICVECHLRLHARFGLPNRWRHHCDHIRRHQAIPYPSVATFFGVTSRERRDIGEIGLVPKQNRWWERLSYDAALKSSPEAGVTIALTYGPSNDVQSLVVSVQRDESLITQTRLI